MRGRALLLRLLGAVRKRVRRAARRRALRAAAVQARLDRVYPPGLAATANPRRRRRVAELIEPFIGPQGRDEYYRRSGRT